jgi:hypothetical protein
MTTTKQKRKEAWEKEHVQRVLDFHNKKYGTCIAIKGKTNDVYPQLRGQPNWDWVCYHVETGEKIAVEIKRLTAPKLEERGNIMWQLLKEVRDSLSDKLPGIFSLSVDIPKDYYLPFNQQENRQEFKSVLSEAIYRTAQKLKLEETEDLKPQITKQLPFLLPDLFLCDLQKVNDEGNMLGLGSGFTGWWHRELDEHELEKFEQLVSHASEQLEKANVKETFLVIIDEGHRIACSDTVAEAFKRINHDSYSHINHVYYLSGEEIAEIPLPTP